MNHLFPYIIKDWEMYFNMEFHKFSFGKIGVLRKEIAEIIIDEGTDINIAMVDEIHRYLLSIFTHSFSLLINKTNSYSTQLDALIKFGTLSTINKIAVYTPNKLAKRSADFAADIPTSTELNIQFLQKIIQNGLIWQKNILEMIQELKMKSFMET